MICFTRVTKLQWVAGVLWELTMTNKLISKFILILENLNSSDGTANEAFRKCFMNNNIESKSIFLRCAVPLHVQRLQEYKASNPCLHCWI